MMFFVRKYEVFGKSHLRLSVAKFIRVFNWRWFLAGDCDIWT